MNKSCVRCGRTLSDNETFCAGCGQAQVFQQGDAHQQAYALSQHQKLAAYGIPPAPAKTQKQKLWLILAIALAVASALCVGAYFLFFSDTPEQTADMPLQQVPKTASAQPLQLQPIQPPPVVTEDTDTDKNGRPAALYQDAELIAFLQGEWVSETDIYGGFYVGMLFHDDMYAVAMASPKREDATHAHWRDSSYWDMDYWDWRTFSAQGNAIVIESQGHSEIGFFVYVHEDDKIWFAYADIDDPDWEETDYIEVKRVRTKDEFDMATYLEGRWISSSPITQMEEDAYPYASLYFSEGTFIFSYAGSASGDPDVSKGQFEGWEFKLFNTYDCDYVQDGFMFNVGGTDKKYKVSIEGFASAQITDTETNATILYYRDLSLAPKEHIEQASNSIMGLWYHRREEELFVLKLEADGTASLLRGDTFLSGTYTFDETTKKGVLTLVADDTVNDFEISVDAETLFVGDMVFTQNILEQTG